jgi:hypothetical protein
MPQHPSDSAVQRALEKRIIEKASDQLKCTLFPGRVPLPGGAYVEVDGAAEEPRVYVEAFARQGALKAGQERKIAKDALKFATLRQAYPNARLILVFADLAAAAGVTGWMAEALATFNIETIVVPLTPADRESVLKAQGLQTMINPPGTEAEA